MKYLFFTHGDGQHCSSSGRGESSNEKEAKHDMVMGLYRDGKLSDRSGDEWQGDREGGDEEGRY